MVSQVVCVVCSSLPEPRTTQITFYKFPKASEQTGLFKAWKSALTEVLSSERPELLDDSNLNDTYVCSQHFTASDFSFDNGKLILQKDAVPSRIAKNLFENAAERVQDKFTKEYAPSSHGNFASTLTKDFVTTSHHNLRSDLISTETSRALTPSVSACISFSKGQNEDKLFKISDDDTIDILSVKKRHADLEYKVESYEKIFKRLRSDNLLTESYVDKLKVNWNYDRGVKNNTYLTD